MMIEQPPLPPWTAAKALMRCITRSVALLATGRVKQPTNRVGHTLRFADGTSGVVYRETVVDRPPPTAPVTLVVGFRLRGVPRPWMHAMFRLESVLNTVLFAGFPGFVSKLWCRHDEGSLYRGVYEWDGAVSAEAYVRALWWVLALVSARDSIHYAILPGIHRDDLLRDPRMADDVAQEELHAWWRLSHGEALAA
jgi:hypothetical protein